MADAIVGTATRLVCRWCCGSLPRDASFKRVIGPLDQVVGFSGVDT